MTRRTFARTAAAGLASAAAFSQARPARRNIVFILTDDQRYDAMGVLGHPWLQGHTPNMDRLLRNGVHFKNAFVTSSLCSPSRASILTGQYMHAHRVQDNFSELPQNIPIFPQLLRDNGYRSGYVGKWHMGGDSDSPQPGFDHWTSFRGQGEFNNPTINRNGVNQKVDGYMTDVLTREATQFIKDNSSRPFCLYLSHKAVHYPFLPPKRHAGLFNGLPVPKPASMLYKDEFYDQLPEWVRKRRYTRHGVDGLFGHSATFDDAYRGYYQCLKSVDESVGEVLHELENHKLLNDTLVVYMGDNGYMWGEHGLVDKRAMYEASMRVPLMAHCPDMIKPGQATTEMALNLDIGPTFLDAAGLKPAASMHGQSLLPFMQGKQPSNWRKDFVYEYEWEQDFPYTPTITGLRTERYSLMQTQGTFDIQELYDLNNDPDQMKNLLADIRLRNRGRMSMNVPKGERRELVDSLQARLEQILKDTGGDPRRAGRWKDSYSFAL